ncbi:hypothetical protein AX774_g415 [Zancudomyces culisetae]|uniref:Uncharacterized protein n=1 Tax=Zancudomyces culisetae TaxID=1213189 RepID=A0A1R1PYM4_ZANCU|nr:hypothetical protein AX774_g415 [Zancudomyces culisetae]|eukprot:OMH86034.1 hypothetical protein AX774_g415 [Zancudomyces culisetae]
MFNLSKIIPLAVLFLIYIVATVSAQGGGDVDVKESSQDAATPETTAAEEIEEAISHAAVDATSAFHAHVEPSVATETEDKYAAAYVNNRSFTSVLAVKLNKRAY